VHKANVLTFATPKLYPELETEQLMAQLSESATLQVKSALLSYVCKSNARRKIPCKRILMRR